ncbi:hypothetical protein LIER_41078 [Lithospermum erythrorhizon]|uniref:Uncharacterized protein n=1 Tax=Lithospermum erythrorhizon TaxID=34254 RepID=A0AAV3R5E1_LITER
MVFVKDQRIVISVRAICLVDDPALFNVYPYGRLVYEELVKERAHFFNRRVGKEGGVIHMKVGTFPFVLQAWVLECLMPEFAVVLARRVPGNPIPRIARWETFHVEADFTLAKQTIYDAEDLQFLRMSPEAGELYIAYYKSAIAWIDNRPGASIPMFPSGANDDEDVQPPLEMPPPVLKVEDLLQQEVEDLVKQPDNAPDMDFSDFGGAELSLD